MTNQPPSGPYGQGPYGQQGPPPGHRPQGPSYGQPPQSPPPPGPPQYGQPPQGGPHGQPPAGPPQYGQPQPGYAQQGYGPQPGQPPYGQPQSSQHQYGPPQQRSGGSGKLILIVGGALAAVAVVALVLVLTLGGSSDEPSADSPVDTVEGFLAAVEDGDCEGAEAFISDNVSDFVGQCDSNQITGALGGVQFGDPEVLEEDEETASVSVAMEFDVEDLAGQMPEGTEVPPGMEDMLGDVSLTVPLVFEGDAWLIDGVPVPDMGGTEMPDLGDMPDAGPAG